MTFEQWCHSIGMDDARVVPGDMVSMETLKECWDYQQEGNQMKVEITKADNGFIVSDSESRENSGRETIFEDGEDGSSVESFQSLIHHISELLVRYNGTDDPKMLYHPILPGRDHKDFAKEVIEYFGITKEDLD